MKDNINIRVSNKNDISEFYKLWKICFNDSDNFCDWLFNNRFFPNYSTVLQINNEIVSCMQGVPYTVNVRGNKIKGAMLCGVSTSPNHRSKGYMGRLFSYSINQLKSENVAIAVHTPAILESYFNFQHFPVADASYIEENTENIKLPNPIKDNISFEKLSFTKENSQMLYHVYTKEIASKFSGAIFRTEHDFYRKWADYNSDGALCYALYENLTLTGYAFFYITENELISIEAVTNYNNYQYLVDSILNVGKNINNLNKNLSCKIKLPPNLTLNNYTCIKKQKGVAGCVDLENLLKNLSIFSDIKFEIVDNIVTKNNGIFNMQGEKFNISSSPAFKIEIGFFLQVLLGYETLHSLKNKITVYNQSEYNELNALLPLYDCYIIDEY